MGEIVSLKKEFQDVAQFLKSNQKQLNAVASRMINPQYLVDIALSSIRKNPKLMQCRRESLFNAIRISAKVGLMPDSDLGEAALVPFKEECVFIPMYPGLITLAVRNKAAKNMWATPVYACDTFEEYLGTDPRIIHRPGASKERVYENLTYCYAVAHLTTGATQHWTMDRDQIEKVRKAAPSYNKPDSPHQKWPLEMCIKTPLRRLFKYVPRKGPELTTALVVSDQAEMDQPQTIDIDLNWEGDEGNGTNKTTSIPAQTKVEKKEEQDKNVQGKSRVEKQPDTQLNKLTQEKKAALQESRTSIRALLIQLAASAEEADTILEQCSFEQDDEGNLKRNLTVTTLDWNNDAEYLASVFRRLQDYQRNYAQESGAESQTQSQVEKKPEVKEKARKATPQVQGLFPQQK